MYASHWSKLEGSAENCFSYRVAVLNFKNSEKKFLGSCPQRYPKSVYLIRRMLIKDGFV